MSVTAIYKILNKINGKFYIGSAVNLSKRWATHRRQLRRNMHENSFLQAAWNKYGEASFEFHVIQLVPQKELLVKTEQFWMDWTKCCDRTIGYNLAPVAGSQLGLVHSQETKMRMSKSQKEIAKSLSPEKLLKIHGWKIGNRLRRGTTLTTETRSLMSKASKGKTKSELHKANISAAHKGKIKSPEHIANIIAGRKRYFAKLRENQQYENV